MKRLIEGIVYRWDRFLFQSSDPRVVPILRVGFALMILIQAFVLWPDAAYWYSDVGVMQTQTAREISGPMAWSLLFVLPSEPWVRFGDVDRPWFDDAHRFVFTGSSGGNFCLACVLSESKPIDP